MGRASSRNSAPAVLLGEAEPRIYTPPLRKLTPETSLGFECIDFAEGVIGIDLYPWQKFVLVHALELLPDGSFRFRKIFLLVGRQNGKSTLLQVLTLWRLYMDHAALALGTAQDRGIARDLWLGAVDMAQGVDELEAEIAEGSPILSRGFEHFALIGGEQYRIAASNRRAGRSLSVDLALMDELREHQSWDAWAAISKTTNARPRGQLWAASNAGDAASIVLRHFRLRAHEALGDPDGDVARSKQSQPDNDSPEDDEDADETLGLFEYSAPPGCSVRDRAGWAQSNPSLGYGSLTERTLASDAANDPEHVFRMEVLCQWESGTDGGAFPPGAWESCLDTDSAIPEAAAISVGIDVSVDRSTTHIAFAARREDGLVHVEVVASDYGTAWVKPWLDERGVKYNLGDLAGQGKGAPVSELLDDLSTEGVPVRRWEGSDLAAGSGEFYDLICKGELRRLDQPLVDIAVANVVTKPLSDRFVWDRRRSPVDVAPMIAENAAVWALINETDDDKAEPAIRWL